MADSDTGIFITITLLFLFIGVMLPIMENDIKGSSDVSITDLEDSVGGAVADENILSGFSIISSVLGMFFWTFGQLPVWLDAAFLSLRITWVYLFIRLVRGV